MTTTTGDRLGGPAKTIPTADTRQHGGTGGIAPLSARARMQGGIAHDLGSGADGGIITG